jgi:CubicO group peptidase (beta-lactamase class C family)
MPDRVHAFAAAFWPSLLERYLRYQLVRLPTMCYQRIAFAIASAMVATALCAANQQPTYPNDEWPSKRPGEVGIDESKIARARHYALSGGGSGYVIRSGALVMQWGDPAKRYDLKSTTKSIGVTALGLAILDGKLKLSDKAGQHHPQFGTPPDENAQTGWLGEITLRHLATQTAGFEKPGGYGKVLFQPGTKWLYSDAGPNWIAECVTLAYRRDVDALMFQRVFEPIGITRQDLVWRSNSYRPHKIDGIARREFGSGISANVDAMARIGYLYLRQGRWRDKEIIPGDFVKEATTAKRELAGLEELDREHHGNASEHYGLLWWNNNDGTLAGVPRDAYWSWGLYDSLIFVVPSLDLVVARAGNSWKRAQGSSHYDVLRPFFEPIVQSVEKGAERDTVEPMNARAHDSQPPYPQSTRIKGIEWAPVDSIIRLAPGGDNWPVTWGKDDFLYTAYGDGRGFKPFAEHKLSLGLARVNGTPPNVNGVNLRAPTLEAVGDGAAGRKASGILMIDGVLYLWARNVANSQLAWSKDGGASWTWADWKFTESFGCPTFLNFGRNYAGARDEFVYIYSHDNDSAYLPADRMVMARAHQHSLTDRSAFEFYQGIDVNGRPRWGRDIRDRQAVFTHQGNCYRSGVTYNAALKCYLWCQTLPKGDARFSGGFGIYDATEPWGPWTTVFFAQQWDVGPGETSSIPTKWISADGREVHLVFSGDDHFSVRKARLILAR